MWWKNHWRRLRMFSIGQDVPCLLFHVCTLWNPATRQTLLCLRGQAILQTRLPGQFKLPWFLCSPFLSSLFDVKWLLFYSPGTTCQFTLLVTKCALEYALFPSQSLVTSFKIIADPCVKIKLSETYSRIILTTLSTILVPRTVDMPTIRYAHDI